MGVQNSLLNDLGDHKKLEEKYFIQKVKLGQGSYGSVWRAIDRETNRVVAVKQMERAKIQRSGISPEDVRREIAVLRACNHETIIRLFDAYKDAAGTIYMALEYCEGGDFGDKLRERSETLQEGEVADWMHQILSAIAYLHDRRVCHRDIKPDNFMVGLNGDQVNATENRLKLADFGLAIPVAPGQLLTERCGTPAFMSPEQHTLPPKGRSRGYGCPVDVWAAGLTMYCLLFTGQHPFMSSRGLFDEKAAMEGRLTFQDPGASQGFFNGLGLGGKCRDRWPVEALDLCKKLVETKPSQRIPAGHALRHVFLQQVAKSRGSGSSRPTSTMTSATTFGATNSSAATSPASTGWFGSFWPSGKASCSGDIPDKNEADFINQGLNWIGGLLAPGLLTSSPSTMSMTKKMDLRSKLEEEETQALAQGQLAARARSRDFRQQSDNKADPAGLPLPAGTACRYLSASVGRWVPAVVLRYDGLTYDLDKKHAAQLDRISPPWDGTKPVLEADAWPAGTAVAIESGANGGLTMPKSSSIAGVIHHFNPDDGTYDLDVRARVPVSQLRPRKVPIHNTCDDVTENPQITRKHTKLHNGTVVSGTAKGLLPTGVGCDFQLHPRQMEWIAATVECYNDEDGTYCIACKSARVERAPLDRLRPPVGGSGTPWPVGSRVSYESASMKVWLPAVVQGYNKSDKTYDLDIRPHADPECMRPRPSPERDFLDSDRHQDVVTAEKHNPDVLADAAVGSGGATKEARHTKIECGSCGQSFWRQQAQQGRCTQNSAICPSCRKNLKDAAVAKNVRNTMQL
eukprot:gnl/MRDRNA2_/MRDRNA2_68422_c0_seq1.p1 gnl/MRDRNA2_/MRDRNA2_68422_c0~~gnl/MRDRNA2_/MRDRNA2_68422_c0_seq1.p1  ORF type:complete len:799 (+),score=140.46 gnl/MRDRNA2_/MRDRNA2_68422_c0_seq1:88-2484(+)